MRRFRISIFLLAIAFAWLGQSPGAGAAERDDVYARPDSWLCRPGAADLCAATTTATIVAADGSQTLKSWKPRADAAVDCFYIYPTISEDPTGNSSMVPGPGEKRAVAQQFAPFASVCHPFAPMYEQITLAGLASVLRGRPIPTDPELAYKDVLAAWRHYLRYDNHGRGVVLIGHSQGTRLLTRLIQEEIDGKPAQRVLAGALLLGFNVEVPVGADRGGTFKAVPLCRNADQVGCIIAYESFRADSPPSEGDRFAHPQTPGMTVACVDPTILSSKPLEPVFSVQTDLLGHPPIDPAWASFVKSVNTAFVSLPGLVQVHCSTDASSSYLAESLLPQPTGSARPDNIPGDLIVNGRRLNDWGLHIVDINLAMGNLVDWVGHVHKPAP